MLKSTQANVFWLECNFDLDVDIFIGGYNIRQSIITIWFKFGWWYFVFLQPYKVHENSIPFVCWAGSKEVQILCNCFSKPCIIKDAEARAFHWSTGFCTTRFESKKRLIHQPFCGLLHPFLWRRLVRQQTEWMEVLLASFLQLYGRRSSRCSILILHGSITAVMVVVWSLDGQRGYLCWFVSKEHGLVFPRSEVLDRNWCGHCPFARPKKFELFWGQHRGTSKNFFKIAQKSGFSCKLEWILVRFLLIVYHYWIRH